MKVTAADLAALHVPCWISSVIRRGELAAIYRMNGLTNASAINRRIRELVDAGLLEHATHIARPVLQLTKPLLFHNPAKGKFDYSKIPALAWQLERRWSHVEMQPACLYYASKRALSIFGGVMTGRIKQPNHATHDCQVAWLYVPVLSETPCILLGNEGVRRGRRRLAVDHVVLGVTTETISGRPTTPPNQMRPDLLQNARGRFAA